MSEASTTLVVAAEESGSCARQHGQAAVPRPDATTRARQRRQKECPQGVVTGSKRSETQTGHWRRVSSPQCREHSLYAAEGGGRQGAGGVEGGYLK